MYQFILKETTNETICIEQNNKKKKQNRNKNIDLNVREIKTKSRLNKITIQKNI